MTITRDILPANSPANSPANNIEPVAENALTLARQAVSIITRLYAAILAAAMNPLAAPDTRQALRVSREMTRDLRRALKAYHKIYRQILQETLITNPQFRARVLTDLGGVQAIRNWKARRHSARIRAAFRAAQNGQNPDLGFRKKRPANRGTRRKAFRPTTDRYGHFRLAVIPTGPHQNQPEIAGNPTKKTTRNSGIFKSGNHIKSLNNIYFKPIEVRPRDLRANLIKPQDTCKPKANPDKSRGHFRTLASPPIITPPD